MPVPEFDQIVEYVTTKPDGTGHVVHFVLPHQMSLDTLLTLEAIGEGYERAAEYGRTLVMPPEEVAAVQAAAAEVYHPDVIAHEITSDDPAEIVANLIVVKSYPEWHLGAQVAADSVWFFGGNLHRALVAHIVYDAAWTPVAARALWTRYYESDEVPEWVQPLGGHDAWPLGARVTHGGHTWVSLIANNVWEPGAAGSEVLWQCEDCEEEIPEFVQPTGAHNDYNIGDKVRFEGHIYESLINGNVWSPAAYPAGWKLIE